MKIITTIPYTKKRADILESVIGQLSDGIWENNNSMRKYWKSLSYGQTQDGMIWIEDRNYVCTKPLDFFANKIKQIVKIEIEDGYCTKGLEWSRHCAIHPGYFHGDVTVGECYEMYELLKGRDVTKNTYAENSDYAVTVSLGDFAHTVVVTALNANKAKQKALEILERQFKVEAVKA